MRLDRLQVAVRPRGVLECLDLALLVCGRRPLGVAVAAALGALPMILLNRAAFAGVEDGRSLALAAVATALEMPWAAAPLTLFLGQVVFSERFTAASWRASLTAFVVAIGPLLLFQTLVRGVAVATCVAVVFALPATYYLGPVILLERGKTWAIPGRSLRLVRSAMDRVMLLLLIDAAVLAVGWIAGVMFIEAISSLWRGGVVADVIAGALDPFAEAGDNAVAATRAFVSWPSQIAFWSAASLVTVFRFFSYLDTRIRHEGWDVELKFRSPETYARLRPTRAAVAVAMLAVGCVFSPAAAAAPPAAADDAAVRAALGKQGFPWYDPQADAYRPMVRVEPEPADVSLPRPRLGALAAAARFVMIAILVAILAAAIWLLVRFGIGRSTAAAPRKPVGVAVVLGDEVLEALPEAARRHDGDLLAETARLAAAGDFAAAIILFHGWQLVQLHGRGVIELARGKTTRRYAAEVAAAAPGIGGLFRRSNRLFEDALFGRLPVAREAFHEVWDRRGEFAARARGASA